MTNNARKSTGRPDDVPLLIRNDPYLKPWQDTIMQRNRQAATTAARLTDNGRLTLTDFAAAHEFFGLHRRHDSWVFRERAPNATACHLVGQFSDWQPHPDYALRCTDSHHGIWEIHLPLHRLQHGDLYRLHLDWPGGGGDRLPAFARRVVQDAESLIFNAQVWQPPQPYAWKTRFRAPRTRPPLIYETHIGMAGETPVVGTFREFGEHVLPRIVAAGYNTLQIMALQEHPYYGSFGYHISNFFALSSRFGTPEEFKQLVDSAHAAGLTVIMDIVHSHAVRNEVEGISRFDGTDHLYFHAGTRGEHPLWDSRLFDYGKIETLHFLLSNCRFWLDEYRVDGFRFDGITSMLYMHHGLGKAFSGYNDYFDNTVDTDALTYLRLANEVIHAIRPDALTIAEDVSGYPGLAAPLAHGGIGFDSRLALGVPDMWTRLAKDVPDENWRMDEIWHELNNRRADERTISYVESHDQALVGDQTLIFRMLGSEMYTAMRIDDRSPAVDRGIALHKMIRLITLATAEYGYLNFMGNEFGHPEWVDFPREGNQWSYQHARRQWSLRDRPDLKYGQLADFDGAMLHCISRARCLQTQYPALLHQHEDDKQLFFQRGKLLFLFNFHPHHSPCDYPVPFPPDSEYRLVLDTDEARFGGFGRLESGQVYHRLDRKGSAPRLRVYLPARTALVLEAVRR